MTNPVPTADFWNGRLVCVTGGSGFLGYHIVQQLLGLGARVRVFSLPPRSDHPLLARRTVECVFGNIRDRERVRRALGDCDVVLHTAAVVGFTGKALRDIHAVNREGTRNVLTAVRPDARVVHTSSVVAIGAARAAEALTEDSPVPADGALIDYVRSKRETEDMALAADQDRHVVVVNPGYMVGPEDYAPTEMGQFCLRFWKGRMPLLMPGGFNIVDVRDVACGHLLAAEHGRPARRYILGGENVTLGALATSLAETAGLKPRWLPQVPSPLLGALAVLSTGFAWMRGKEPDLSRQHAQLSRYYWFSRSDRAASELGYRARPLAECLADTYRWFESQGKISLRGLNSWWMRPAPRKSA